MESTQDLIIERIIKAPRKRVWEAWTIPAQMMLWWGPKDYTAPTIKIDLRTGGSYLYCMRSPKGENFWSTGHYAEIVENEKLVCTDSFADEAGNVVPATHYGMSAEFPLEMLVTVTLEDVDGGTKLTLRHGGLPAGEMLDLTKAGWNESFDKLEASLR